jgi:septal ring factor EnvC (AmiA/AmiB activator)
MSVMATLENIGVVLAVVLSAGTLIGLLTSNAKAKGVQERTMCEIDTRLSEAETKIEEQNSDRNEIKVVVGSLKQDMGWIREIMSEVKAKLDKLIEKGSS